MNLFLVLCLVALAVAAPQRDSYATILRYDNDNDGLGNYRFAYEQSDGIRHEQQGELKNRGREDEGLSVKGRYSWLAPNGVRYIVTYVADENGYQPEIEEGPGEAVSFNMLSTLVGAG